MPPTLVLPGKVTQGAHPALFTERPSDRLDARPAQRRAVGAPWSSSPLCDIWYPNMLAGPNSGGTQSPVGVENLMCKPKTEFGVPLKVP